MSDTVWKQAGRWFSVTSSLGEDALLADGLDGDEGLSAPFRFEVSALTTLAVQPSALLGSGVTVSVSRFGTATRAIHGLVTGFAAAELHRDGYRRLRFVLEPAIVVMRHSSNYRIFQDQTVQDIATALLSARSITDFRFDIVGAKAKRDYCVQFGETDLDFLSRLLDEEGWFFFFEHAEGKHTLVISDSETKYTACAVATLTSTPGRDSGAGVGLVQDLELRRALIDMKWTSRQFDFTAPASPIDGTKSTSLGFTSLSGWERFRYGQGPAVADDQTGLADASVDAAERDVEVLSGVSGAPELTPGQTFTLKTTGHDGVSLLSGGDGLDGQSFVVTSVSHAARDPSYFYRHRSEELKPSYRAAFTAIPAARPFRPRRAVAKRLAPGPQTALVVGPSDAEVYTDKYGRIRVQFNWDRLGSKDENSSCFIRVAQSWAGNAWGMQFIPRIGMEVVVSFLDGDPDQPIVTGVLYNGANSPPFALPAQLNKSGLRTRSSKQGSTETFSELSFDDTKDSEMVLLHAQKDFTRKVENDDTLDVGHDQKRTIKNDRTTTISEGSDTYTLSKGDRSETISRGSASLTVTQGDRTVELTKGDDTLKLTGGNLSITLSAGNAAFSLDAGNLSQTCAAGSVTIEALQGITLKCGPSSIELAPQGITIKGPMVTATADAKAEISGLLLNLKADGIAQLNGGLVKIN